VRSTEDDLGLVVLWLGAVFLCVEVFEVETRAGVVALVLVDRCAVVDRCDVVGRCVVVALDSVALLTEVVGRVVLPLLAEFPVLIVERPSLTAAVATRVGRLSVRVFLFISGRYIETERALMVALPGR